MSNHRVFSHPVLRRVAVPSIALAAICLATACAGTRASTTAFQTLAPKASPNDVQVFIDGRPSRDYQELGLIEVAPSGIGGGDGYGRLIQRAREEAARIGADAILVTREHTTTTTTSGAVNPVDRYGTTVVNSSTATSQQPKIVVTAVAWKVR